MLAEAVVQEVEHKKTELEKAKVEAELSSLVKGSEDPIYIVDGDCRFVFANEEELERHGLEREEMMGERFHDLHSGEGSLEFEEKVEKVLESGEPERQKAVKEEGENHYVRTLSPVENPETGEVDRVSVI
ncbi:hypothetical protein AKJ39_03755, partial [candidate division MSBL1 archaeon SCGC-AAA259J03]